MALPKIPIALRNFPMEAAVWLSGLMLLALIEPTGSHISICPLALSGIEWCPGCGLGRSISLLFRGEFEHSFVTHPLGIFAVIVLSFRIIVLTKNYIKSHGAHH